jgi:hypothetical protein
MLVISIPTKMIFTGNQTLIRFHVSGSVGTAPDMDSVKRKGRTNFVADLKI